MRLTDKEIHWLGFDVWPKLPQTHEHYHNQDKFLMQCEHETTLKAVGEWLGECVSVNGLQHGLWWEEIKILKSGKWPNIRR